MRPSSFTLLALSLFALSACTEPVALNAPDGTTIPTDTPTGTPTGDPTGPTAEEFPFTPFGNPGNSPTGGDTERRQGFLGWRLDVLPSGELQLRFKQTGLTVSSFAYVVGATVEGDVQCYNKADNAPQGQPFRFSISAGATLGAQAVNGTIDAIVSTNVLENACGNTQFTARPVTTTRPFQWSAVYLDNPAGRLPLPDIKLGDAPLGYWSE